MDNQQIFDKVLAHLRRQGAPARGPDSTCCYRTDDGRMCAVGCLIPSKNYSPDIEGFAADSPEVLNALPFNATSEQCVLLKTLQEAHDKVLFASTADWEFEMERIANLFGLQYTASDPA